MEKREKRMGKAGKREGWKEDEMRGGEYQREESRVAQEEGEGGTKRVREEEDGREEGERGRREDRRRRKGERRKRIR